MPNVRYWVNSGRHMLAASSSGFDPGCVKTSTSNFRVEPGPKAVISHNASIARLYLGLLFSSAAERVVLAAA
jgi:hypothetical protein